MATETKTRIVKPKTKRGARALKQREPQQVEEVRRTLFLFGSHPSQTVKDVLSDLHSLQRRDSIKYTRRNEILPFENGGEVSLEHFSAKTDSGQFVLATNTKKRPNNLVLGRFFNHRIFDLLELGVESFKPLKAFGSAASGVQAANKPALVFCGEQFEHDSDFKLAKSMLIDLLKGRVVDGIDLMGFDHVIFFTALERTILFRQYAIRLKKSGTKIPRIELQEMGPSMNLAIRRTRTANPDVEQEALKQSRPVKKKEKNVSSSLLDGKVGRIYMPKQQLSAMPQHKLKGLKRSLDATKEASEPAGKLAKMQSQTQSQ